MPITGAQSRHVGMIVGKELKDHKQKKKERNEAILRDKNMYIENGLASKLRAKELSIYCKII
jgi:hypothetical protein